LRPPARHALVRALALAAVVGASTGCFETGYLLQAGEGQLDLVCSARSIDHVIDDPDTPEEVRAELAEVPRIKGFGKKFGLVPTSSYEDYVELDRPVAVWVVSAAPKLSFDSLTWSFPIVGSVPYLGWFDRLRAEEHADSLRADGWDVDLRGASAYSTLGFFKDPVLSSMLGEAADGFGDLADTILHESLHATVYMKGQTSFNEGLATFVGEHLAIQYLVDRYGDASKEVALFQKENVDGAARTARFVQAFQDLDSLYRSDATKEDKLARKAAYLAALRAELHLRKAVTNATLAGYREYHGASHSFDALLEACGGDMKRFIAASKLVKAGDFKEPQQKTFDEIGALLAKRGCSGRQ
jgi:predicted aminopeptidase